MPKLKRKDLAKIQYTSVADYYANIDRLDSLEDKLAYTTRYILSRDPSAKYDYALAHFVQLARVKIAESAAKAKEGNLAAGLFLSNPAEYLKGEAKRIATEIEEDEVNLQGEEELKEKCEAFDKQMYDSFNADIAKFDKASPYFGVKARMEIAFGGKKGLEEVINATKPSLFSKIFTTYSAKFVALEDAYETFNNPAKNGFCDMDHLNDAAVDYLKYKFPKWEPGQDVPAKAYAKLNATETAKVNFSLGILNAIKEQRAVEEPFHSLTDSYKEMNIQYADTLNNKENEAPDMDQALFQQQIRDAIEAEEHSAEKELEDENDFRLLKDDLVEDGPEISK